MSKNTLTIDGKPVSFKDGDTIMEAAIRAGIYIPHLCHNPELIPQGNCRLCEVKINGRNSSACTFPAAEGQNILNNTKELNENRRTIIQMLFVEGNHLCPGCEKSGNCKLQAIAYSLNMLDNRFPLFYPKRETDSSHPDILLDRNRCIFCEMCVRASHEVDGKDVFAISGRGINNHLIVNSPSGQLKDSSMEATDKAAHVCPVGAIIVKRHGFEIPIGQRIYDNKPIGEVSMAAGMAQEEKNHG
ncbi:MAG: NADP oxidoreductase [Candidatus Methylumidiphilus alinenensis]|uniref:NADH-quinone oxidoreductase subunit G n=1 Tax=Candidatus Methylumidiphilus alinenensis TaxID=2202197 RepID=A0A2W4TM31_9GAMM|nr:MAG: NADP oxidoreductase [Candidatus Methylumidiphilus alinenensis]